MDLQIIYSKKSLKFFKRNSHILTESRTDKLIQKSVRVLLLGEDVNVNLSPMRGRYAGMCGNIYKH